jgi:hypothetical protein
MAKQSELERIAIDERTNEFVKSPYSYDEQTPYSAAHPDALADGDNKGKGTNTSLTHLNIPTEKGTHATSTMMGITVDTDINNGAGNVYDTDGTKGVDKAFQGDAGRNYLAFGGMNPYNANNEYGPNSVDTTNNTPGQYWVE